MKYSKASIVIEIVFIKAEHYWVNTIQYLSIYSDFLKNNSPLLYLNRIAINVYCNLTQPTKYTQLITQLHAAPSILNVNNTRCGQLSFNAIKVTKWRVCMWLCKFPSWVAKFICILNRPRIRPSRDRVFPFPPPQMPCKW